MPRVLPPIGSERVEVITALLVQPVTVLVGAK